MTTPAIDYQQLAGALLASAAQAAANGGSAGLYQAYGLGRKTVSSTPTTTYGHGNGGLFSAPGLERPVFSAMLLPGGGLQSLLPARPTITTDPYYGIFTGVTATSGSEPTGPCDDPPTSGLSKMCTHAFKLGRQARMSRVFELDRMGKITNRGEFTDFQFLGNPFTGGGQGQPPAPMPTPDLNAALNTEVGKAIFELAVAWIRDFAQEVYTGNPANNTASGGRKYYDGLDRLINTGYRDAETNVLCPAADSIVESFGNLVITTNGAAFVRRLTYMYRNLKYIAEKAGLAPVQWVIAMRWGAFYEATEIWPIAYQTYRNTITGDTNQQLFNDGRFITEMRDQMRQGNYLLIDGEKVPVALDEGIAETEPAAGVFSSSIYIVPLAVLGATPVTFFEYINYDTPQGALAAAEFFAAPGMYYTSDSGRFLWHRRPPVHYCVQLEAKTEPRLLLLTPHLAARLTNVRYSPLLHERESFTDAGYFVDGGRTDRVGYGPSFGGPTGY